MKSVTEKLRAALMQEMFLVSLDQVERSVFELVRDTHGHDRYLMIPSIVTPMLRDKIRETCQLSN